MRNVGNQKVLVTIDNNNNKNSQNNFFCVPQIKESHTSYFRFEAFCRIFGPYNKNQWGPKKKRNPPPTTKKEDIEDIVFYFMASEDLKHTHTFTTLFLQWFIGVVEVL